MAAAVARQCSVQAGEGGGVLAGVQRCRNLAHGDVGVRHQQVDQRGLAHAGLADEDRRLAGQQRQQGRHRLFRMRCGPTLRAADSPAPRTGQRARARAPASRRTSILLRMRWASMPAASHATSERETRSSAKLGSVAITMNSRVMLAASSLDLYWSERYSRVRALGDLFDHGLVVRGALQVHDVAHRDVGLLAARDALQALRPSTSAR